MPTRHVTLADMDEPGPWWIACEHPERENDEWTVWSWDCTACMLHLVVATRREGADAPAETFGPDGREESTVADTLIEAMAWRAEMGLPHIDLT